MSIGVALLISQDGSALKQCSRALQTMSLYPQVCGSTTAAMHLLNTKKFDAVIVDLQLGEQSGRLLDELHVSSSNRTAVAFAIGASDNSTATYRKKATFVFERPLCMTSMLATLKSAYGLILRERRRYFRCPISVPVMINRRAMPDIHCYSVNISEGGMALSNLVPITPGETVHVEFTLPGHKRTFSTESTVRWSKTGRCGIRFVSLTEECQYEIQEWLAKKLEELLPPFVAEKFSERHYSVLEHVH